MVKEPKGSADDEAAIKELGLRMEGGSAGQFNAMFEILSNAIDRQSAYARLSSLPTTVRYLLACVLAFGPPALLWVPTAADPRWPFSPEQMALFLAMHAGLLGLLILAALRPLHLPTWPYRGIVSMTTTAFVGVFLVALWPATGVLSTAPLPGAHSCLFLGFATGLVLFLLLRLLDRGQNLGLWLSGGAATLFGNAILQVHCGAADVQHRLLGHASVGLAYLALVAVSRSLPRLWLR